MKRVTILSGKGGVGKSSIAASLAVTLAKACKIIVVDCDVNTPNLGLILGMNENDYSGWKHISTNKKAEFNLDRCSQCGKCVQNCYFNAIEFRNGRPALKGFGCEGCGVCELVCPKNAIRLVNVQNALIGHGKTKYGFRIVTGQLEIGESGSGKIVAEVKRLAESLAKYSEIMLIDSAAGIGCPVIASVTGSDYIIAVTEPTQSGFCDLKSALKVVKHFKIPFGVVVNKYDINSALTRKIEDYVKLQNSIVLENNSI